MPNHLPLGGLAAIFSAGCIFVTVPAQSPVGPYVPVAAPDQMAANAFVDVALWPTTGANIQLPANNATIELGGQLAVTSTAFTPALWLHSDANLEGRAAHRLGLAMGAGDILGIYAFTMPFLGASYHYQRVRPHPKHWSSSTIGLSFLTPLVNAEDWELQQQQSGAVIITWPCAYFNARWAWAWPLGPSSGDRFILSTGFDVEAGIVAISLLATPIIPTPALGFAFQFGPSEDSTATRAAP